MRQLRDFIKIQIKLIYDINADVELSRPEAIFGDFSTNVAMKLSKEIGQNPKEIADKICDQLNKDSSNLISRASVAGPGFINILLSDQSLIGLTKLDVNKIYNNKTITAEYSDPNPFKPLHAGHLYTTLVGDVIARLVDKGGAKVVRLNYGGDVGLHVGRSMWAILRFLNGENAEKLQEIKPEDRSIWLGQRYVEGTNAYEENEDYKQEIININKRVYEVQKNKDFDSNFAKIYWICREWSYEAFKLLYDQLEVHEFDRFIPESEVVEVGLKTVNEQLKNGVYSKSDGAIIFKGEDYNLHSRVFINSQGLPTYETKEVGLILTKWKDYHFDKSIIVTGNEIIQYMQVVLKSIEQFEPELTSRTVHISHGMVKLAGGVKMSSRKGNTITAQDIIESAEDAGKRTNSNIAQETILAAIKYSFVKNRIGGDVIYDPEESIALEGNSGPYIQYAHARARGIILKSNISKATEINNLEITERSLVRKIGEYVEVLDKSIADLSPHLICSYLYELAQEFNRFYETNRVIGDDRESIRLKLVEMYADRLKDGLTILGIVAPERM